jgi:hypothetical protein
MLLPDPEGPEDPDIFFPGEDPRAGAGILDLRPRKRRD